ncbi:MAG: flavin reductase [Flavobacteriales bacterium]|jgi:flavin reductase (DIM6/NTAB) family NADH-FMN oxidoreductase RutF|nr:flavin reductase [Flavobacteriales bacterium]
MELSKTEIEDLDRIKRLNIINAITGIKPGNLLGSKSSKNETNLAIFSSVIHLGSHPALLGIIVRPANNIRRDTYENILNTGFYTINHINNDIVQKAHYSSVKFDKNISEFNKLNLNEQYIDDFYAPFLKESYVKIGMKFKEEINIKANGTKLIVGQIVQLSIPDIAISKEGYVNLEILNSVGIGGLNSYYTLKLKEQHPFARVENLPNFNAS